MNDEQDERLRRFWGDWNELSEEATLEEMDDLIAFMEKVADHKREHNPELEKMVLQETELFIAKHCSEKPDPDKIQ